MRKYERGIYQYSFFLIIINVIKLTIPEAFKNPENPLKYH